MCNMLRKKLYKSLYLLGHAILSTNFEVFWYLEQSQSCFGYSADYLQFGQFQMCLFHKPFIKLKHLLKIKQR